ncbi:hypothetical protein CDD83_2968 [Cordyceps sp. RAO-2017]|nr:hypothetical protein CDD83_2968 [Cordyceps sp. RAO-2017]
MKFAPIVVVLVWTAAAHTPSRNITALHDLLANVRSAESAGLDSDHGDSHQKRWQLKQSGGVCTTKEQQAIDDLYKKAAMMATNAAQALRNNDQNAQELMRCIFPNADDVFRQDLAGAFDNITQEANYGNSSDFVTVTCEDCGQETYDAHTEWNKPGEARSANITFCHHAFVEYRGIWSSCKDQIRDLPTVLLHEMTHAAAGKKDFGVYNVPNLLKPNRKRNHADSVTWFAQALHLGCSIQDLGFDSQCRFDTNFQMWKEKVLLLRYLKKIPVDQRAPTLVRTQRFTS